MGSTLARVYLTVVSLRSYALVRIAQIIPRTIDIALEIRLVVYPVHNHGPERKHFRT